MKITNEKNFESILPDPDELYALNAYKSGDSEYQPSCSQEELMKNLELYFSERT